jgi:hypothetical protein
MTGTTTLAQPLLALLMSWTCMPAEGSTADTRRAFQFFREASVNPYLTTQTSTQGFLKAPIPTAIDPAPDLQSRDVLTRETTPKEHTIGELRRWKTLLTGWDGGTAQAPIADSLQDAVRFVRLLTEAATAEPMLHATGRAGLFWRASDVYADLEFLGSGRIAYFIERNGDKHKGVVNFDAMEMPAVFEAVLPT